MGTYKRYTLFDQNGTCGIVPFGKIPARSTDFHEIYHKGKTRLDILSYQYYGDANYGWLIMQANPQYGSMEYEIPDGVDLRIPYPLSEAIGGYEASIDEYNKLYK